MLAKMRKWLQISVFSEHYYHNDYKEAPMARIKINDLPRDVKVGSDEMKRILEEAVL
jgi:hypothetical protein